VARLPSARARLGRAAFTRALSALARLVVGGAGLGFLARDALGMGQPAVMLAWIAGAALGVACGRGPRTGDGSRQGPGGPSGRSRPPHPSSDSGQAAVEWVGALLAIALALGALVSFAPSPDAWPLGGFLAHHVICAAAGDCDNGDRALVRAYGQRDAALVREHAPNLVYEPGEPQLPVDFERCRARRCADAPDQRDTDVHHTSSGEPATVFTRLVRKHGRVFIQYWLYYADSNTAWAGSDKIWEHSVLLPVARKILRGTSDYPGFHLDDWESVQVRIDPDGGAWARTSTHGQYQSCKFAECRDKWARETGWARVSRGSHSGHIPFERKSRGYIARGRVPFPRRPLYRPLIPGRDLHERTTTSEGLRLIPLETLDTRGYRRLGKHVAPPWEKDVYDDPEEGTS
jgi:hypothetical protein